MTMYKALFAVVLLGLFTAVCAQDDPPDTVDELNVDLYVGRWYQMFANIIVNVTFERNSLCVTADYEKVNDTQVNVYNSGRQFEPDGEIRDITGIAYVPDPAEPGQLIVDLLRQDPVDPPPGDYWVVLLGPDTFGPEGLYQYSVVTNPERLQLYVLARDIQGFREDYQDEVLGWLADNGFDTPINEPIETYHEADCEYTDSPF